MSDNKINSEEWQQRISAYLTHGDDLLKEGLAYEALQVWGEALEMLPPHHSLRVAVYARIHRVKKRRRRIQMLVGSAIALVLLVFFVAVMVSHRPAKENPLPATIPEAAELYAQFSKYLQVEKGKEAAAVLQRLAALYPDHYHVKTARRQLEQLENFYRQAKICLDQAKNYGTAQQFSQAEKTLRQILDLSEYSYTEVYRLSQKQLKTVHWSKWMQSGQKLLSEKNYQAAIKALAKANELAGEIGQKRYPLAKIKTSYQQLQQWQARENMFVVQCAIANEKWDLAQEKLSQMASADREVILWARLVLKRKMPSGMVLVPQFPFVMGDLQQPDEMPPHLLDLPAYFIDRCEVSNGDYYAFTQNSGHRLPRHWQGKKPPAAWLALPVTNVSWQDACAYARWKKRRLPSEAEWEKAARAVVPASLRELAKQQLPSITAALTPKQKKQFEKYLGRRYPWGNFWAASRVSSELAPVTSNPSGSSAFGCLHLAGNVWEWVDDWYRGYHAALESHYFGEKFKVVRGGSHLSPSTELRSGNRAAYQPDCYFPDLGFRCAISLAAGIEQACQENQ